MQSLLYLLACVSFLARGVIAAEVLHEWVSLNYTWDEVHTYKSYIRNGKFIPENCILAGINVDYDGKIYLTVPRWRPGVPATLNVLNTEANTLTPFPSWEIQEETDPSEKSLKNIQSMTIDSKHNMWMVDVGRRNFFAADAKLTVNGPAAVRVYNLRNKQFIHTYFFPDDIVPYADSFLNDIALDEVHSMAYFSDAWGRGAIIAYDFLHGRSRRYSGPSTGVDPAYVMVINGVNYGNNTFTTPIDGLAVTSDGQALFYCAVQGTTLFRVSTGVLRDWQSSDSAIDSAVESLGVKEPSDGMKYFQGQLFWGSLPSSSYSTLQCDATAPVSASDATSSPSDPINMEWPDTFAVDLHTQQHLMVVTNGLDRYLTYAMDFTGATANMRILRLPLHM